MSIVRNRANGLSDYHKIVVSVTQRTKHGRVLDRLRDEFGGTVAVRNQRTRVSGLWAEQTTWQLQDKPGIQRFFDAIAPHAIIKAPQVALGTEFIRTFQRAAPRRDRLGRIHGNVLGVDEIERRERLRLAMRELNTLGPLRGTPSQLPPLDIRHRRVVEPVANEVSVARGADHPGAKLTDDAVRAIRAAHATGITKAELARQHGVSFMLISGVVRGTRWRHVPDQ